MSSYSFRRRANGLTIDSSVEVVDITGYAKTTAGFILVALSTCILGVALVSTAPKVNVIALSNLAMFSIITNLFLWYFLSSEKISWKEGAVLLFMYFLFLTIGLRGYAA